MGQSREPARLSSLLARGAAASKRRAVAIACNCGNKNKPVNWVYTAPDGSKKTYRSEIEAQAAKVRNRGGTVTTVPA